MNPNLTQLPPPPTGQVGINPNQFSHLPPPPQGQQGFTLDQIKNPQQPSMPLLTGANQGAQSGFGTALKDVAVGAGKDLLSTARDTAGLLQSGGKAVLGAFGADTSNLGINSLDNSTPAGAGVANNLAAKSRGEQVGKVLSGATQLVAPLANGNAEKLIAKGKSAYEGFQASREAKATADATDKITEMISPKATAKEAKLAQAQGRFVEGKPETFFKSSTPPKILPSKKTLSATDTIIKNIPEAPKMSPSQLYKAVDENITKTATDLRPEMAKTPIKPETVDKINNDWEALKKTQLSDAPATEEPNVIKRQGKFESLLRKSGSGTHADLWDTRIAYDDSIPEGVKKATSLSPESQQIQKEEWLQNRAILNDAINDSAHGMGKTSQNAFGKMSDMYEAKNGLLSQTKLDTGVTPSKLSQAYNSKPAKIIKKGLGLLGAKEVLFH